MMRCSFAMRNAAPITMLTATSSAPSLAVVIPFCWLDRYDSCMVVDGDMWLLGFVPRAPMCELGGSWQGEGFVLWPGKALV